MIFYLHKEFREAEIPILCTQRIRRGRDPILSTSTQRIPRGRDLILSTQRFPRGRDRIFSTQRIFYKINHEKSMVCFKTFSALRALIC